MFKRLLCIVPVAVCAFAHAQTIFSESFDTDNAGALAGQNGWFGDPNFQVVGQGGLVPSATSGTQLVAVDGLGSVAAGNYIGAAWTGRSAGNDILRASADVYVSSGDPSGRSFVIGVSWEDNSGSGDLADIGISLDGPKPFVFTNTDSVSYTHLTLPTNREV